MCGTTRQQYIIVSLLLLLLPCMLDWEKSAKHNTAWRLEWHRHWPGDRLQCPSCIMSSRFQHGLGGGRTGERFCYVTSTVVMSVPFFSCIRGEEENPPLSPPQMPSRLVPLSHHSSSVGSLWGAMQRNSNDLQISK